MKAFIKCILGVLRLVKAYYGCVEAQGRSTLHCHMLVWLEGSLNPNEIKDRIDRQGDKEFRDRLLSFLDDAISNYIPDIPENSVPILSDGYHASAIRGGIDLLNDRGERDPALCQRDLHNLVKDCQIHSHSKTCFKYCGDGETQGELCLRCLNGMVNNFNETILRAMRCNMDIKFIGSGASAKAVLYYITDYITKSQLKTHIAYAALELSVKKLGEYNPNEDEITVRAKHLLQYCAYTMLSHQELSGQQVTSYLMDFEDHFTSHEYQGLYWGSFEQYIEKQDPSPECSHYASGCMPTESGRTLYNLSGGNGHI
ncbi:uncharacterized protein EV420DRAFT_1623444 [Desarmillaria tabescens]|uniref:Helitron helicase-like domain-containing protein n=1 Tax=Armillaria tabescens TaxID=1929756 RepID=A0AA39J7J1_ARMTA|nr:uncharacterized protein EV420DRAFT_1623444 [Desarmillaria tabescens]KAK0437114.1 hypothetical protein EV420DRAFT_1623444 [Desarmillaria tabescens]